MTRRARSAPLIAAAAALVAVLLSAGPIEAATAASNVLKTGLPSRTLTPGATNPAVTQATIGTTICVPGWTDTVRPSSSYTNRLKVNGLAQYGYTDRTLSHYEEDHLISLELGGSTRDPRNLWPEPIHIRLADGTDVGSHAKNALANHLKREVCAHRLSLHSAQQEILVNWVGYWRAWMNPDGGPKVAAAKKAGATAICVDGSWAYTRHRSGTCARHGGVYWWTGNVGKAGPG